jgi:hypothetical protein
MDEALTHSMPALQGGRKRDAQPLLNLLAVGSSTDDQCKWCFNSSTRQLVVDLIRRILDAPGESKLRTFNALLSAGPRGTRPDQLALLVMYVQDRAFLGIAEH